MNGGGLLLIAFACFCCRRFFVQCIGCRWGAALALHPAANSVTVTSWNEVIAVFRVTVTLKLQFVVCDDGHVLNAAL